MEIDRVKAEVSKRKAEPLDEIVITKKAKLDNDNDEDSEDSDEEEDWQKEAAEIVSATLNVYSLSELTLLQLEKEAEEERQRQQEEQKRIDEEAAELKRKETARAQVPDEVTLSLEEAKALFKV